MDGEEGKADQGVLSCLGWGRVELDEFQVQGRGIRTNRTGALGFGAGQIGSCLVLSVQFDEIWRGTEGLQVRKLPN